MDISQMYARKNCNVKGCNKKQRYNSPFCTYHAKVILRELGKGINFSVWDRFKAWLNFSTKGV